MRVLYISQEITPYLPETEMSTLARQLPQAIQERGREIRTFMPRYGCVNERRNQLHEVLRLSGMNIIIDDTDHPLTIKVASIQAARMQVYFIDNDDFFGRKATLFDPDGKIFPDTDERMIFFARGVLETIKKLRWVPDVVHCHGWFTSVVPLLIKTAYSDDPLLNSAKVVYSAYNDHFDGKLSDSFKSKLESCGIGVFSLKGIQSFDHPALLRMAMKYSDAVICASQNLPETTTEIISKAEIPVLEWQAGEYADAYLDFYDKILL